MARAHALLALVVIALLGSASAQTKMKVVHYNDVHGRVYPATSSDGPCVNSTTVNDNKDGKCFGGIARVKTVINTANATGVPLLVLDAGDQFVGTIISAVFQGQEAAMSQRTLGINAFVLGNHEFDYGPAGLAKYLENITANPGPQGAFPIVTCNVDVSAEPLLAPFYAAGETTESLASKPIRPWAIITLPGSTVKVGVIGVTTREASVTSSPGPKVVFKDPVASVKTAVTELNAYVTANALTIAGVILLSHVGYYGDKDIAASVDGIGLIVGGHSHSYLNGAMSTGTGTAGPLKVLTASNSGDVPSTIFGGPYSTQVKNPAGSLVHIVQAYAYTRYAGSFTITWTNKYIAAADFDGSNVLLGGSASASNIAEDADALSAIEAFAGTKISSFSKTVLLPDGLSAKMYGSSSEATEVNVRLTETNMGNFMADAALWSVQQQSWPAADKPYIAIMNGGGSRVSWEAGLKISVADVYTLSPFGNYITVVSVPGSTLLELLENGYSRIRSKDLGIAPGINATTTDYRAGRFAQVAGLQVYVDGTRPQYKRVRKVSVINGLTGNTTPLSLTANYTVVTNNFMAGGGDGYFGFKPPGLPECTATATSPCGKGDIKLLVGPTLTDAIAGYIANQTAVLTTGAKAYPLGYVATSPLYKGITSAYRFYQCDNLPWATDQVCKTLNVETFKNVTAFKAPTTDYQAKVTFLATFGLVFTEFPFNDATAKAKFIAAFEAGLKASCGQAGCVTNSTGWAAGSVVSTATVTYPVGTSTSIVSSFVSTSVNNPASLLSSQSAYFDSIPGFSLSSGFVASGATTTAVTTNLQYAAKTFEFAGAVRTGSAALGAALTAAALLAILL